MANQGLLLFMVVALLAMAGQGSGLSLDSSKFSFDGLRLPKLVGCCLLYPSILTVMGIIIVSLPFLLTRTSSGLTLLDGYPDLVSLLSATTSFLAIWAVYATLLIQDFFKPFGRALVPCLVSGVLGSLGMKIYQARAATTTPTTTTPASAPHGSGGARSWSLAGLGRMMRRGVELTYDGVICLAVMVIQLAITMILWGIIIHSSRHISWIFTNGLQALAHALNNVPWMFYRGIPALFNWIILTVAPFAAANPARFVVCFIAFDVGVLEDACHGFRRLKAFFTLVSRVWRAVTGTVSCLYELSSLFTLCFLDSVFTGLCRLPSYLVTATMSMPSWLWRQLVVIIHLHWLLCKIVAMILWSSLRHSMDKISTGDFGHGVDWELVWRLSYYTVIAIIDWMSALPARLRLAVVDTGRTLSSLAYDFMGRALTMSIAGIKWGYEVVMSHLLFIIVSAVAVSILGLIWHTGYSVLGCVMPPIERMAYTILVEGIIPAYQHHPVAALVITFILFMIAMNFDRQALSSPRAFLRELLLGVAAWTVIPFCLLVILGILCSPALVVYEVWPLLTKEVLMPMGGFGVFISVVMGAKAVVQHAEEMMGSIKRMVSTCLGWVLACGRGLVWAAAVMVASLVRGVVYIAYSACWLVHDVVTVLCLLPIIVVMSIGRFLRVGELLGLAWWYLPQFPRVNWRAVGYGLIKWSILPLMAAAIYIIGLSRLLVAWSTLPILAQQIKDTLTSLVSRSPPYPALVITFILLIFAMNFDRQALSSPRAFLRELLLGVAAWTVIPFCLLVILAILCSPALVVYGVWPLLTKEVIVPMGVLGVLMVLVMGAKAVVQHAEEMMGSIKRMVPQFPHINWRAMGYGLIKWSILPLLAVSLCTIGLSRLLVAWSALPILVQQAKDTLTPLVSRCLPYICPMALTALMMPWACLMTLLLLQLLWALVFFTLQLLGSVMWCVLGSTRVAMRAVLRLINETTSLVMGKSRALMTGTRASLWYPRFTPLVCCCCCCLMVVVAGTLLAMGGKSSPWMAMLLPPINLYLHLEGNNQASSFTTLMATPLSSSVSWASGGIVVFTLVVLVGLFTRLVNRKARTVASTGVNKHAKGEGEPVVAAPAADGLTTNQGSSRGGYAPPRAAALARRPFVVPAARAVGANTGHAFAVQPHRGLQHHRGLAGISALVDQGNGTNNSQETAGRARARHGAYGVDPALKFGHQLGRFSSVASVSDAC